MKVIAVILLGSILGASLAGGIIAAIPGEQGLGGILLVAVPLGLSVGVGTGRLAIFVGRNHGD